MTRQKVDPDKRQRTAHACESCKRRKQKCDGKQPCAACSRRHFDCTYQSPDPHYQPSASQASSSKRRSERPNEGAESLSARRVDGFELNKQGPKSGTNSPEVDGARSTVDGDSRDIKSGQSPNLAWDSSEDGRGETSDDDEEAEVHTMVRMLEDTQGRLQYVGDSANLSFLQLLRMIVETLCGPSSFSLDLSRHRITERQFETSPDVNLRFLLPTKELALILTDAFFTNTYGVMEVFVEKSFLEKIEKGYEDTSSMDRIWLCHFYLVLAVGFSVVTPKADTRQHALITSLRASHPMRGEEYYFAAKKMSDPLTGFEDAGFWSIQALTLMALYMLNQSRRNTAYVYTGMAIRSSHALGVHREEVLIVFPPEEQEERRKLWRSLFVLDLFLSVSLGRPLAISDDETSGSILNTTTMSEHNSDRPGSRHVCAAALEATMRSCHIMRDILRKVYYPRKISVRQAQIHAQGCREWPKQLPEFLHWRIASPTDVRQAIAILHCNLMHCHSIILLSRPFFLHLLSNQIQRERLKMDIKPPRKFNDMQRFSDACIDACTHTIGLTYAAYAGGYLPRLHAIPSYCVFSAALVIFVNALAKSTSNGMLQRSMNNSITILEYCGENDPQASRAAAILKEFGNVIRKQHRSATMSSHSPEFQAAPLPDRPHYLAHGIPQSLTASFPPVPGPSAPPVAQGFGPPLDLTSLPGTSSTASQWPYYSPQDAFAGENAFRGATDFDHILPSASERTSSADADEFFNFDRLWDWPSGSPLPMANPPNMSSRAPQRGPYNNPP